MVDSGSLEHLRLSACLQDRAFEGCSSLRSLFVRAARIGNWSFYGCQALESLVLESTTHIGHAAFAHAYRLESLQLPETLREHLRVKSWRCFESKRR